MEKKGKRFRGGIAQRWVTVTLIPTLIAFALAFVTIYFTSRNNYYYSAEQAIGFRINTTLQNLPPQTLPAREKYLSLVELVESFSERDTFEFMLLDVNGNVLVTSGGFAYTLSEDETDFRDSLNSPGGRASFTGQSSSREHVIAVTQQLDGDYGDVRAIRFVSSLKGVDRQLRSTVQLCLLGGALLLAIITVTGSLFIRSMTVPILKIGNTAKQVAAGDLDVRIENEYTGEIGELCDIINDMATELENSSNLKNDFISSISHEIRTPLTSIKGWGETLAALKPEEEKLRAKGLETIISETDRLQQLVEDLLDFSKLEANRALSLSRTRLDLRQELNTAVLTLEQRAKQLGISVRYDPECDELFVNADRNKLRQVFTNISDNAVKYSPRRGTIYVRLYEADGYAAFSIRDEGSGIPADEVDKVTQKYYRASNSVYGTGIGLSLVNEIVKAHSGKLVINSVFGSGTEVIVMLPPDGTDPS